VNVNDPSSQNVRNSTLTVDLGSNSRHDRDLKCGNGINPVIQQCPVVPVQVLYQVLGHVLSVQPTVELSFLRTQSLQVYVLQCFVLDPKIGPQVQQQGTFRVHGLPVLAVQFDSTTVPGHVK
jgi:hypothetical protein